MMVDARLQPGEPLDLHVFCDLILAIGGRRSWARRILERKRPGVADVVDDAQRIEKILLGFTRETDDEIRRERYVRTSGAQPPDGIEIFRAGMPPVHRGKH